MEPSSNSLSNTMSLAGTSRDSYLQVITAQTAYLDNERNQVEIRRQRMDASVLLIKALGGGWTASALPTLGRFGSANAKEIESQRCTNA